MHVKPSSIPYASFEEVQAGRGAQLVTVEDDVLDVVRRLKKIHPDLNVRWNPQQEYFVIYELCQDGKERLVTTTKTLDVRLVEHFEKLAHESWDAAAEMEKMDSQAQTNREHQFAEKVGEIGERLHHALRKDKEVKDRIWLPS